MFMHVYLVLQIVSARKALINKFGGVAQARPPTFAGPFLYKNLLDQEDVNIKLGRMDTVSGENFQGFYM